MPAASPTLEMRMIRKETLRLRCLLPPHLLLTCLLLALSACGGDRGAGNGDAAGADANLPKPEVAGGSVTGMPDTPGPGQVGPPPANTAIDGLPPDTPIASDGSLGMPPADDGSAPGATEPAFPGNAESGNPEAGDAATGTPEMPPALPAEPTPQDAVAAVRDYYAAIDARQYARAYALWSGGGNASGQTPQQFAGGFADTVQVAVETQAPGRVDAAAGSRYIEVPVAIRATHADGSVHRYVGAYVLRRAVVDGASAEQRAWRIASADLREVK
jgi:hypothetical protein